MNATGPVQANVVGLFLAADDELDQGSSQDSLLQLYRCLRLVPHRWQILGKQKIMTVSADEFLRRFLIHVLPRGSVRIRHFGLFANRRRAASLLRCRALLGPMASSQQPAPSSHTRCSVCSGDMLIIERMTGAQLHFRSALILSNAPSRSLDSS